MSRIAVIADDLSGAVESAACFMLRTTRIIVTLPARPGSHSGPVAELDPDVQVVDTDSRELPAHLAAARVTEAAAALGAVPVLVKKIDSLLRGNIAVELLALQVSRPNLVIAPALPATGRTVRDGQVWVGDEPLHETDVWRAEAGTRPQTIAHALHPLPVTAVSLAAVRGPHLAASLHEILAAAAIPVCDAETDDDLDRIAAAVAGLDQPVLVGSAGIAAAAARQLAPFAAADRTRSVRRTGPVLAVVGSAAPGIAAQLSALTAIDATVLLLTPAELVAADSDTTARATLVARLDAVEAPIVVVAVDAAGGVDPQLSRVISRGLADVVTGAAGRAAGLVLTGGETARAVLDRLGVTTLRPLTQVHHGAVVCTDDAGRAVATRPGSFGGPDSLLHLVTAVRNAVTGAGAAGPARSRTSSATHEASPHPPEESA